MSKIDSNWDLVKKNVLDVKDVKNVIKFQHLA